MLMKPNQYDAQIRSADKQSSRLELGFAGRVVLKIENYLAIRKQHTELLSMSDGMLHDIGLNRADAERIASQSFNWFTKSGQS